MGNQRESLILGTEFARKLGEHDLRLCSSLWMDYFEIDFSIVLARMRCAAAIPNTLKTGLAIHFISCSFKSPPAADASCGLAADSNVFCISE